MADIINGYKTVFPIPLALGCSYDFKLVKETAQISAKEAKSKWNTCYFFSNGRHGA